MFLFSHYIIKIVRIQDIKESFLLDLLEVLTAKQRLPKCTPFGRLALYKRLYFSKSNKKLVEVSIFFVF